MHDLSPGNEVFRRIEGRIKQQTGDFSCLVIKEVNGAMLSSFRAGGTLCAVAYPENRLDLCRMRRAAEEEGIRTAVLGAGTNLVIPEGFHEGLYLSTARLSRFHREGNLVFCEAGVRFPALAAGMEKKGLSLGEELSGIPGSIGGMLRMNASAYGRAIGDILVSAEIYDLKTDKTRIYSKEEMGFAYRKSILRDERYLLLSATLEGLPDTPEHIRERRVYFRDLRIQSQPLGYPSLGCYFKRANGRSPGEIIDSCGLKGLSVGGAAVSEKHAAFLINKGGATVTDLLLLAENVKNVVFRQTGILLEEEVVRIR